MTPISPKPHERAALIAACLVTIAAVLLLLAVQMFGGLS